MELLLKIPLSTNKQISDCMNDLKLLKQLWDYVSFLHKIFENWRLIRMDKVNANQLSDDIGELKKALKLNVKKEIKTNYPAYNALYKRTNEMDDTIQCIMLLKDKAIKMLKNTGHEEISLSSLSSSDYSKLEEEVNDRMNNGAYPNVEFTLVNHLRDVQEYSVAPTDMANNAPAEVVNPWEGPF